MKRKGSINFIVGFLLGAMMFSGTVAFAAGIVANPTTSKVLVNGEEVALEAYNIHGNNFFMLRDVADAVDFSVVWDGENNRVLIDTSRGYDPNETYAPEKSTEPPVQSEVPEMTVEEMKAEIVRLTNIERVKAGLPELEVLPELMDCAQAKADDMYANDYYGHNSPTYGTPADIIVSFVPNTRLYAENLAPWTKTPQEAFDGWLASAEHRTNILNERYEYIGVGVVEGVNGGYWWVQQFVKLR
jgi:uncharacterized protein YkwD